MSADLEPLRAELRAQKRVMLTLRITPKASKTEWAGRMDDGAWKLKVAAVPEKGKANDEIVRFLAREFSVSRRQITILSGATSQRKLISITN
jgi:uncharacterized protein (TIGR00251 family)